MGPEVEMNRLFQERWPVGAAALTFIFMAACAGETEPQAGAHGQQASAQAGAPDCVPLEEGDFYRVENGRLVASAPPEPVIIEREAPRPWHEQVESELEDEGLGWLEIDARNAGAGVVMLTGVAPGDSAKARALQSGEAAIRAVRQGQGLLVIDGIALDGGAEPVGAALADLGAQPSVLTCQTAFRRLMRGRDLSFDGETVNLTPQTERLLDAAAGIAFLCRDHAIEIGGHTGASGEAFENLRLSGARADAVREALIARGVPAGLLEASGYGEGLPLVSGDSPAANARNARIEFTVRERG